LFEHTIETDDQKFTRKNHGDADQYYSTWQDQRYFLYRLVTLVVVTGMQQSRVLHAQPAVDCAAAEPTPLSVATVPHSSSPSTSTAAAQAVPSSYLIAHIDVHGGVACVEQRLSIGLYFASITLEAGRLIAWDHLQIVSDPNRST
jgi:hypothetical protein